MDYEGEMRGKGGGDNQSSSRELAFPFLPSSRVAMRQKSQFRMANSRHCPRARSCFFRLLYCPLLLCIVPAFFVHSRCIMPLLFCFHLWKLQALLAIRLLWRFASISGTFMRIHFQSPLIPESKLSLFRIFLVFGIDFKRLLCLLAFSYSAFIIFIFVFDFPDTTKVALAFVGFNLALSIRAISTVHSDAIAENSWCTSAAWFHRLD